MTIATFGVFLIPASSLAMKRSPGPSFWFAGQAEADHVDLGPGGAHDVVEPLAEQRARLVQAGGVDQDELRVRAVHDAAHGVPGRLRPVGGDRHLLADQSVREGGLARVGAAHEAGEAGPVGGVRSQSGYERSWRPLSLMSRAPGYARTPPVHPDPHPGPRRGSREQQCDQPGQREEGDPGRLAHIPRAGCELHVAPFELGCARPGFGEPDLLAGQQFGGDLLQVAGQQRRGRTGPRP